MDNFLIKYKFSSLHITHALLIHLQVAMPHNTFVPAVSSFFGTAVLLWQQSAF